MIDRESYDYYNKYHERGNKNPDDPIFITPGQTILFHLLIVPEKMVLVIGKPELTGKEGRPYGTTGCHIYQENVSPRAIKLEFKSGSEAFIMALCSRYLGKEPTSVAMERGTMIPMYKGKPIYVTEAEEKLFRKSNVDKYHDKTILGSSQLIKYPGSETLDGMIVVDKLKGNDLYVAEGVAALQLANSNREGIISYCRSLGQDHLYIVMEIAEMWEMDIIEFEDRILIKSKGIFGCRLKSWIKRSIESCAKDKIPIVQVSGHWADYDRETIKELANVAYSKVISLNPSMYSFVDDLKVLSDGSLAVPLSCLDDHAVFLNSINEENMIESSYQGRLPSTDLEVNYSSLGVQFNGKWVIQIKEEIESQEDFELFKELFNKAWLGGEFVSRWGDLYYIKTGKISSLYATNQQYFDNVRELNEWLA